MDFPKEARCSLETVDGKQKFTVKVTSVTTVTVEARDEDEAIDKACGTAWKYDAEEISGEIVMGNFYERELQEHPQDGPRMVYICAPLRGDVERNIEFARQKAQEVFQAGDLPVCPHLMFPPIADPENPEQDLAAREMGLRLLAVCQQLNVYGPNLTDGMLAEIQQATRLGIEVRTEQNAKGRCQSQRQTVREGRDAQ